MKAITQEHQPLFDIARRFVDKELMPLEKQVLKNIAAGEGRMFSRDVLDGLDAKAKEYGLWALDIPEELGGSALPAVAMIGVNEALGRVAPFYMFPPDSINLLFLLQSGTAEQKRKYLEPSLNGNMRSGIAVSEPGGGGDPAGMTTRAVRDGNDWVVNGRKIWITNVPNLDFVIMMAATGEKGARRQVSSFIVEIGTPGFVIERKIPMIGGMFTYELLFENMRLPASQLIGEPGQGFGNLQKRFSLRRLQLAANCVGMAQRAHEMMMEYVPQRKTFGTALSDRQAIQWWAVDGAMQIHAARLMLYDAAWKLDHGEEARVECAMCKIHATEMATIVIDHAMQAFGAMGMTRELPLSLFAETVRWIRIGEGPSEVHRAYVAKHLWRDHGVRLSD
ncbi:acyl-CoA dehydrogenase family protein [Ramlibacter sp.]|uniref:acyl-CoA dehydrogenase family protein n=1 Tax=Ramlibacter sp. TaxID=1917967 RepID=UPI003D0B1730